MMKCSGAVLFLSFFILSVLIIIGLVTTSITYPGFDFGFLIVFLIFCYEIMTLCLFSLELLVFVSFNILV